MPNNSIRIPETRRVNKVFSPEISISKKNGNKHGTFFYKCALQTCLSLCYSKLIRFKKAIYSTISTSQFVRRFQLPFLRNPPHNLACPSCRQPFPPVPIRQTNFPYTCTQVRFLTIQIDFFLQWQKKIFLHLFNTILQSKIISKSQHPFLEDLPLHYTFTLFLIFPMPSFEGGNQNSLRR